MRYNPGVRILQICSARAIGGGERHVMALANQLTRRGHNVFVALTPGSSLRPELRDVPAGNIVEVNIRNALSLGSAVRLARFARTQGIEIIHAHLGRDYPLAAVAAGRTGAQLILTRHVLFPLRRVHRLTLRRTARVIAVSRAVAEALRRQQIFPAQKICIIHNGVDVDRFTRPHHPSGRHGPRWRIGAVGELAPVKGYDDLINAARQVIERKPDVEFIIAGEDKSRGGEHRRHLVELISSLGLNEQIKLSGWADDPAELLATFDLFVSTSRSESFGMAIAEAMAAGLPVIATASEGAAEIIEADRTGKLVPIGNREAIAEAVVELLNDEEERTRLGLNAQAAARERFSIDRMIKETEQLYGEVLSCAY